ncbi:hypothetical protein [Streptomyces griseocarneus]|uniref:hypothetical protein n=1 Tax=Streptomyces griseocarneus TaxID=51201 RepID=UPI00167E074C|nr:hypothetical protein [Streptomyces griseocarneus]MBZ6474108.1 hypothetical protein [Streptomyces griseocarneus]GHG52139.1 hypothetical protein GCM10018779_12960 [Streptomyces griseocarneus]
MAARDERGLVTRGDRPKATRDTTASLHPAFERFLRTVRADVESRLTPDEVQDRLRRLLGAATAEPEARHARKADVPGFDSRAGWAAYGYRVVRLWLSAVATAGRPGVRLNRGDIDELTVETVARALNSFRDQVRQPVPEPQAAVTELKAAFLAECVRHLPYVNRSRHLMTERVSFDEFEDTDDVDLVGLLWDCATTEQAEELRRVARDEDGEGDTDEIVTLTPIAVRAAVQRYPEAVTPGSMA